MHLRNEEYDLMTVWFIIIIMSVATYSISFSWCHHLSISDSIFHVTFDELLFPANHLDELVPETISGFHSHWHVADTSVYGCRLERDDNVALIPLHFFRGSFVLTCHLHWCTDGKRNEMHYIHWNSTPCRFCRQNPVWTVWNSPDGHWVWTLQAGLENVFLRWALETWARWRCHRFTE